MNIFITSKVLIENTNNVIKNSKKQIEKLLLYDCNDINKFMKTLESDTININNLYSLINLLLIINPNNNVIESLNKLNYYNNEIKENKNFIEKLQYFNKLNISNKNLKIYQKKFINNILSNLDKNNININNIYYNGITFNNNKFNIYNFENNLIKYNKRDRHDIILKFNKNIYNELINNINNKNNIAKENGYENYLYYINNFHKNDMKNIKNFIIKLLNILNIEIEKSNNIQKNNYNYDDILIYETNFNLKNLTIEYLLDNYIKFYNIFFNINIELDTIFSEKIKYNKLNKFNIIYNSEIIGVLYIDFSPNNKPKIPVNIILNNNNNNIDYSIKNIPTSYLIFNVENLNNNINMYYSKKFFIQLFNSINNISIINSFGFNYIPQEYNSLFENFAEKIFTNEFFLTNLYGSELLTTEYIDNLRLLKLIKFKNLCIESLYDFEVYSNNSISDSFLIKKYNELLKKYLSKNYLNPLLLNKIDDKYAGKYYYLLYSEIIAHNLTKILLKYKNGYNLLLDINNININNSFNENLINTFSNKKNINNNLKFILKINKDSNSNEISDNNYYEL